MFELIILIGALAFALKDGRKGIVAQAASVVGFLAGIVLARALGSSVNSMFGFEHPFGGYVLAFLVGSLVCALLSGALHTLLQSLCLDWANHLLGAALGALKWLMICSIVLNLMILVGRPLSRPGESRVADLTTTLAPKLLGAFGGSDSADQPEEVETSTEVSNNL
jgi:uncharacterized membrane protein required for colicin V production